MKDEKKRKTFTSRVGDFIHLINLWVLNYFNYSRMYFLIGYQKSKRFKTLICEIQELTIFIFGKYGNARRVASRRKGCAVDIGKKNIFKILR